MKTSRSPLVKARKMWAPHNTHLSLHLFDAKCDAEAQIDNSIDEAVEFAVINISNPLSLIAQLAKAMNGHWTGNYDHYCGRHAVDAEVVLQSLGILPASKRRKSRKVSA